MSKSMYKVAYVKPEHVEAWHDYDENGPAKCSKKTKKVAKYLTLNEFVQARNLQEAIGLVVEMHPNHHIIHTASGRIGE